MGEKVETVGYCYSTPHGRVVTKTPTSTDSESLMTVAQHERIVAGFRAGVEEAVTDTLVSYPVDAEVQAIELRDAIMKRIDAFLARAAEE